MSQPQVNPSPAPCRSSGELFPPTHEDASGRRITSDGEVITDAPRPWPLRSPCAGCGGTAGRLERRGPNDVVKCAGCDRFSHCAPRSETEPAHEPSGDRVLLRFPRKPSREGGAREELRVSLRSYEGKPYVDVRTYFEARPEWRPTPKGVTIRTRELDQVAAALTALAVELGASGRVLQ